MTIKSVTQDELVARAQRARVNIEPGTPHNGVYVCHALIDGVLYTARVEPRSAA